ncbi:uncharacterized protein CTRU02_214226 [Colletotrichum truncatum]|uniref:Uncharacterized protein n=1 Tax=Colletotrichum truncatum TaxID=5467 RepID=A0ACC3YIG6_COLTU
MALDRLAPELLCTIMSLLDSSQDLYSFIKASPDSLRAFLASRNIVLTSVIQNVLSPDIIHHAIALLYIPEPHSGADYLDVGEVGTFLDQYLQLNSWRFPKDLSQIISLTRLTARVHRFVNKFFASAMETLGISHEHGDGGSWPLSATEHARLHRAFLRFEVYCQLCPPFEGFPQEPFFSPQLQFEHFLSKLEPWEVKELSCVYEYFTTNIGQYIADFQDSFVQTVLGNSQLRVHPNYDPQSGRFNIRENFEYGKATEEDMYNFRELDQTELALFSTEYEHNLREYAGFMASLGLEFLEDLMSSSKDRRRDLIRRNSPRRRGFLPEAIQYLPDILFQTVLPEGDFTEDSSRPSKGWLDFESSPYDFYRSISFNGTAHRVLCMCGYVFWDSKRILHPTVHEAFMAVVRMDETKTSKLYRPSTGKSAEVQLNGLLLPGSEMSKIYEKFGSMIWLDKE